MYITELKPNQVFVFGTNESGFHGAGAAGLACRGDARNNWREDAWFRQAMRSPVDSDARIGKWAVYGVASGYMAGREGCSYGIITVTKPGARRSKTRREIYAQLVELWEFIWINPHLEFLITPLGEGYAGYTAEEMQVVWDHLQTVHGRPANIKWLRPENVVALSQESQMFQTLSGLVVATDYTRIVIGGRGPYIEFDPSHMIRSAWFVPPAQKYRLRDDWKNRVFYYECRSKDESYVKLYVQRKTVSYADYRIGMLYISPDDLRWDGKQDDLAPTFGLRTTCVG